MIRLGVNLDHVATVRQARRAPEPDPVHAATLAILGGADGITIHLRADRRLVDVGCLDCIGHACTGQHLSPRPAR